MARALGFIRAARDRFWVLPGCAIVLGVVGGLVVPVADREVTLPDWIAMTGQADTARAALTAIVALGVSVAGVSFSVIAVALVLASQQLSPRVLRSFQRQTLNQALLAMLLGTATYALFVLGYVSDAERRPVPELSITVAMALAAIALALFVLFLHHVVRSLNASVVIRRIAAEGHESIETPYPEGSGRAADDIEAAERAAARMIEEGTRFEVRAPRAGYIASVDGDWIVKWARTHDAFVEQRRPVGGFAMTSSVLAVVHRRDADREGVDGVHGAFLLNEERMVDGDIAFPIRQLADIALKGLSPGMNDPTTAENAMDSITDTLVRFAQREGLQPLRVDENGAPRMRAIVPTLDDLVRLGFDQVRRDSASRPSFAVRLLELLADLRQAAPAARECREIERQSKLIADQAAALAEHEADQQLVSEAYERLSVADDSLVRERS